MRSFRHHSSLALLLGVTLSLPMLASAQTSLSFEVTDHTNAVWDVSHLSSLRHVSMEMERMSGAGSQIDYDAPFMQLGGGRLQGSGSTELSVQYRRQGMWVQVPDFTGTYRANGSVTGARGKALVTFHSTANGATSIDGTNRQVTGRQNSTVRLDAVTGMMTGRSSSLSMGMGMGAMTDHHALESEPIPAELGDGSWTLHMNFDPPVGNTLSGQGDVTLKTGMVLPFKITGTYAPKTHTSQLHLKGIDAGLHSTLQVKLVNGEVKKVTGLVSGQMVRVIK